MKHEGDPDQEKKELIIPKKNDSRAARLKREAINLIDLIHTGLSEKTRRAENRAGRILKYELPRKLEEHRELGPLREFQKLAQGIITEYSNQQQLRAKYGRDIRLGMPIRLSKEGRKKFVRDNPALSVGELPNIRGAIVAVDKNNDIYIQF